VVDVGVWAVNFPSYVLCDLITSATHLNDKNVIYDLIQYNAMMRCNAV